MRVPVTWLRELVEVPETARGVDIAADLVRVGLEEDGIHGGDVHGPLVVGRVLELEPAPQKNGKVINYCRVDVGDDEAPDGAEIVCGAHNFGVGDLVVVARPGANLPGGFAIAARKTYGRLSQGMICSVAELGLGDDHDGIIVLTEWFAERPEVLASLTPGLDALPLLGLGEEVVEVAVTPDRGYAFSMRGVARDYALSRGSAFTDPVGSATGTATLDSGFPVSLSDGSPIHGRDGCDRYVARVVRGVDPTAVTPSWMQARLTQCGMRPISLAVDVTNYLMLLTGQPLHAFDLATVTGPIVVRRARPGERLTTIDGVDRLLDVEDLLITDAGERPLAIAGVMGGADSGVSASTVDILVEAAHFTPVSVARSSRRHRLITESSRRFERGVDPAVTAAVASMAADMLVAFGGGAVDDVYTDVDRTPAALTVTVAPDFATRLLLPSDSTSDQGLDADATREILERVGCRVDTDGTSWEVTPPSWRPDLTGAPDLTEEVARTWGYDRIPSILPQPSAGRGLDERQRLSRRVADLLAARGCDEVVALPFVAADVSDTFGHDAADERRHRARIHNPVNDEAPLMRSSLLETLMETTRLNIARGARRVAVFEVAPVVLAGAEETAAPVPAGGALPDADTLTALHAAVPAQPRHVAAVWCGEFMPAGPWGAARGPRSSDAVSTAVAVTAAAGIRTDVVPAVHAPWHPGRCAALVAADTQTIVGHAGEIHPRVCRALGLPEGTCAMEVDLDALTRPDRQPIKAGALSTFPPAHSDVALTVERDTTVASVVDALRAGAGEDVESIALFDVYEGEQVGDGKKSLAFRLTFRSPLKTMTTDEANALRDHAVRVAAKTTGAVQRGA